MGFGIYHHFTDSEGAPRMGAQPLGLENSEIVRLRRWVPAMVHCLAGGAQGEMG